MATFVLVHGAFVGGWAGQDAARVLRTMGHEVYTPTLTGLGERVHLGGPETNLETFIQDVINVLQFEDLYDVVLVSWSYSGMVVAAVADRVLVLQNGQIVEEGAPADLLTTPRHELTQALVAARLPELWTVPPSTRQAPLVSG